MAERATIARPYAKAAFAYAREGHALVAWSEGLGAAAVIMADPRVVNFTKSPGRAASAVTLMIEVAGERLNAGMQNFLRVLAENRRLGLLPEIAAQFAALRAGIENTVEVHVCSAVPLNAVQTDKLQQALAARLKRGVRMQTSVDSTLIGGAVIRAGDLVIDGSLKGRLERLATDLAS